MDKNSKELLVKILFILCVIICLSSLLNSAMALVGGFIFAHFLGHPFVQYNQRAVNWLLKIAIVGLGFGMNIQDSLMAGKDGLSLTVFSISLVLVSGFLTGIFLNMNRKTTHLISSGTAICGGSAIAAVAPVIKASNQDISIALGVVFFFNSVALILFPVIGHFFELSQYQFGLWAAIAIHDTSSVVGAAVVYGDEALNVATTVKLARALWIIPLSLFSIYLFKGKNSRVKIPWFILFFIISILINSYLTLPDFLTGSVTLISKSILVLTLFLIGAGLSVQKIKAAGWKPMTLGLVLWLLISSISLLIIIKL